MSQNGYTKKKKKISFLKKKILSLQFKPAKSDISNGTVADDGTQNCDADAKDLDDEFEASIFFFFYLQRANLINI